MYNFRLSIVIALYHRIVHTDYYIGLTTMGADMTSERISDALQLVQDDIKYVL